MDIDRLLSVDAVPGLVPPVAKDGTLYVDAMLLKDANLSEAVRQGADEITVIWTVEQHSEWRVGRGTISAIFSRSVRSGTSIASSTRSSGSTPQWRTGPPSRASATSKCTCLPPRSACRWRTWFPQPGPDATDHRLRSPVRTAVARWAGPDSGPASASIALAAFRQGLRRVRVGGPSAYRVAKAGRSVCALKRGRATPSRLVPSRPGQRRRQSIGPATDP